MKKTSDLKGTEAAETVNRQGGYYLLVLSGFVLLFVYLQYFKKNPSPPPVEKPATGQQSITPVINLQASQDSVMKHPCYVTYFKLGFDYFNLKRYEEAADANLQALRYDPNSYTAWNNLCSAYNELHDWDKAVVAGKKAVQLKPDFELAKNNLNWAEKNKAAADPQKNH